MDSELQKSKIEKTNKELPGLSEVASLILKEKPEFVIIADAHVVSEPQDVAAKLLEQLSHDPQYRAGTIGFYIEALFSYPLNNPCVKTKKLFL